MCESVHAHNLHFLHFLVMIKSQFLSVCGCEGKVNFSVTIVTMYSFKSKDGEIEECENRMCVM